MTGDFFGLGLDWCRPEISTPRLDPASQAQASRDWIVPRRRCPQFHYRRSSPHDRTGPIVTLRHTTSHAISAAGDRALPPQCSNCATPHSRKDCRQPRILSVSAISPPLVFHRRRPHPREKRDLRDLCSCFLQMRRRLPITHFPPSPLPVVAKWECRFVRRFCTLMRSG